jgi:hypothetical protein
VRWCGGHASGGWRKRAGRFLARRSGRRHRSAVHAASGFFLATARFGQVA